MRILMYGDFNFGGGGFDGATTKTRNIYDCLKEKYEVDMFNIEGWRKKPIQKILELRRKLTKTDVLVFVPGAKNGTLFALKYFSRFKKTHNIKLYYFVAGSLLSAYLKDNSKYIPMAKAMDGIFCETRGLIDELKKIGIENTFYSPTFEMREPTEFHDKVQDSNSLYACSFCRVTKEKGIGIVCQAVIAVNQASKKKILLDIYGKIDPAFQDELFKYINNSERTICYRGVIDDDKVLQTLSSYDTDIFATYFPGECLPATVIECLKSSTPVVVSDWKYNREIIDDGVDGYVFGKTVSDLIKFLTEKMDEQNSFRKLRKNSYEKSKKYSKEECLKELFRVIGE